LICQGRPFRREERVSESPADSLNFEQALAELERTVRELEDGQPGLEDSLARYERGVTLLKHCYGQLARAEQRILLLTGADADGKPLTTPFEHAATAEAKPRAKKKPGERG
jgi:exodeoxyribonuclease VII small subunit